MVGDSVFFLLFESVLHRVTITIDIKNKQNALTLHFVWELLKRRVNFIYLRCEKSHEIPIERINVSFSVEVGFQVVRKETSRVS